MAYISLLQPAASEQGRQNHMVQYLKNRFLILKILDSFLAQTQATLRSFHGFLKPSRKTMGSTSTKKTGLATAFLTHLHNHHSIWCYVTNAVDSQPLLYKNRWFNPLHIWNDEHLIKVKHIKETGIGVCYCTLKLSFLFRIKHIFLIYSAAWGWVIPMVIGKSRFSKTSSLEVSLKNLKNQITYSNYTAPHPRKLIPKLT